jgi:hypothetical protein
MLRALPKGLPIAPDMYLPNSVFLKRLVDCDVLADWAVPVLWGGDTSRVQEMADWKPKTLSDEQKKLLGGMKEAADQEDERRLKRLLDAAQEGEAVDGERDEEEEAAEGTKLRQRNSSQNYVFKELTKPDSRPPSRPSKPATPPSPASPPPPKDPLPPPPPAASKAAEPPPLPRFITQFRTDAWFDYHFPGAFHKTFDFIREPVAEGGPIPQVELAAFVGLLVNMHDSGAVPGKHVHEVCGRPLGLLFSTESIARSAEIIRAICTLCTDAAANDAMRRDALVAIQAFAKRMVSAV